MFSNSPNPFVKTIDGITFIDSYALENAIGKEVPAKDRLRQKMMKAGVEFWDDEQQIVKKPVIGISTVGSFLISLEGNLSPGMIKLRVGKTQVETPIEDLRQGLRDTMGMQSAPTYMNQYAKNAAELYNKTTELGHFSIANGASVGVIALGISKKAELEFDVQRDLVHLARETSARHACQDDPTLVAITEDSYQLSKEILNNTKRVLDVFDKTHENKGLNWLEERNSLFPLSASVTLGINGSLRSFQKILPSITDKGKEYEFRNALALINDSLYSFFPELFKPTTEFKHEYPKTWSQSKAVTLTSTGNFSLFQKPEPKPAILLLGAPGVGKSTQTARLTAQLPGIMVVSTGNLVRKLNQKVKDNLPLTDAEKYAAESLEKMRRGELMDDKAVYNLLMAHLSPGGEGYQEYAKCSLIILDGIIKAPENVESFNQSLEAFNKKTSNTPMSLGKVVNIAAPVEELILRHRSRYDEAAAKGLAQRPDDAPETYKKRLEAYTKSTEGILAHYKNNKSVNFIEVDGSNEIEQTNKLLLNVIKPDSIDNTKKLGV